MLTSPGTAGRMTATGHLIGYVVGSLDLKSMLGSSFGGTQFKQLTVISALALVGAVSVTCWAVTEKILISDGYSNELTNVLIQLISYREKLEDKSSIVYSVFSQIVSTARHMPRRIQGICWIQFWSWIGGFSSHVFGAGRIGLLTSAQDGSPSYFTVPRGLVKRISSTRHLT